MKSSKKTKTSKKAQVTETPAVVVNPKELTTPLTSSTYEQPNPVGRRDTPSWLRDVVSILVFIAIVIIGAWLINNFVFQSFNVVGPSMEPTLEGESSSDRLIVNRLPVTAAHLTGKEYTPSRGEIIVFKNPLHGSSTDSDEYIVKRVVGLAGERITVNDCQLLVHNYEHPDGYDPYPDFANLADNDKLINTCVDGDGTDVTVPTGHVFVVGDHRVGNYSMDSRNGDSRATLGTIPLEDIVGPVAIRIWPIDKLTLF
ncbi:MAG: signal peptidase I [Candidatus Saccharibacteria bacterium]|nr:signal peptidase I [Candidatus Saccharibacteria bacterium]